MRTTAAQVDASPTTLWRCGGRGCASGETDHEDEELRRHANGIGPTVAPPIVHDVLRAPGQPLPGVVRRDMEQRFGHDFADVRVHTDTRAAELAAAVHAHAYTVGRQVVFADGRFDPASGEGKRLLAHELTHVAENHRGRPAPSGSLRVSCPDEPAERRAASQSVCHASTPAAATLMREPDEETATESAADEGTQTNEVVPLATPTATSGTFKDDIQTSDKTEKTGGVHAADWASNVKAKLGGDGGKVEVSGGNVQTSLGANNLIDGATYSITITKTIATLDSTGFTDAGEKAAAQKLADALAKHEQKHKDNELTGRKGFAASLSGKKDSAVSAETDVIECKVGKTQRALDNREGNTTLDSSNNIVQSGVDHPEYESTCKKP